MPKRLTDLQKVARNVPPNSTAPEQPKPPGLTIALSDEAPLPKQTEPAPLCPNCPDTRCVSTRSTPLLTKYKCPNNCGFGAKVPRPEFKKRLERMEQRAAEKGIAQRP